MGPAVTQLVMRVNDFTYLMSGQRSRKQWLLGCRHTRRCGECVQTWTEHRPCRVVLQRLKGGRSGCCSGRRQCPGGTRAGACIDALHAH